MFRKIFIILSFFSIISSTLHGQYKGGSGAGFGFGNLSSNTCTYDLNPSLLIFAGGKGSGTSILTTSTTACTYALSPSLLIFAGGKGSGSSNLTSIAQSCPFTINESVLIFKGGSGGGTSTHASYKMACPEPISDNIFLGGSSSSGIAGALNSNTVAYTNGPFIATILDTSIVNGNCLQLSITGTGATTYSWTPTTDLSNPSISNPIAKPTITTTYTVTATNGTVIGCRDKASVTITVLGTGVNTSISYPSKICNNVTTLQTPNLTGITGGQFSSSSPNLKIDAKTGQINPNTSSIGVYTVTYTYGTCNEQVITSVEVTNDCTSNIGVIEFPNFYTGGAASVLSPSNLLLQAACTPNLDYTQLIYAGGAASVLSPSNLLVQAACTPNLDYTQLIYKGGQASSITPSALNIQLACPIPVGDNFYLGGAGVGYGNGSLTPTTNAVTGTAVKASSDVTICPGNPVTLTATGAVDYLWSLSDGTIATSGSSLTVTPTVTTTYIVKGTDASVGCINTAKVTVVVQNDPNTSVSYGAYIFDETDLNLKKVKYINGPLSGTFSFSPTGLSFNNLDGSFTPGLSTSGIYAIKYDYRKGACDYTYTTNINITKLPPTISYTNNAKFYINYNGVTLTPNVTGGEAVVFEILDPLPTGLTYNTTSGVISGTPTALIDNLIVRIRAANYKKDNSINWGETFSLTLSVKQPVINLSQSTITSLNTIYGTPSTNRNINVEADNIIDHVLVIAPAGFETSVYTNTGFADTIKMYPTAERNIIQPLYIRLKKTANVGNYDGVIQLTSTSASSKSITTSTSYVAPATLTITARYFQKFYGSKITLGAGSRYFTSTGLMNNETIGSVTITPSGGTAFDAPVGYYNISPSAAVNGTFSSSNYNINYVPGQFQVVYSLYNFNMSGNNSNWVKGVVPVPKMTNLLVSNITKTTAIFSGKIPNSFVNIDSYGICYSTSISPTINDNQIINGSNLPGTFNLNLSTLTPGTNYFARVFITVGNSTFYSQNIRFKTQAP